MSTDINVSDTVRCPFTAVEFCAQRQKARGVFDGGRLFEEKELRTPTRQAHISIRHSVGHAKYAWRAARKRRHTAQGAVVCHCR